MTVVRVATAHRLCSTRREGSRFQSHRDLTCDRKRHTDDVDDSTATVLYRCLGTSVTVRAKTNTLAKSSEW